MAAAVERGAAAVVVEREAEGLAVPQVVVPHGGRALGVLVGRALGAPADRLVLIGVTGTNGKTTTSYLIESILAAAGARPGVIGTVIYRYGGRTYDSPYTTPTPEVLHRTLAEMVTAGSATRCSRCRARRWRWTGSPGSASRSRRSRT